MLKFTYHFDYVISTAATEEKYKAEECVGNTGRLYIHICSGGGRERFNQLLAITKIPTCYFIQIFLF